MNTSWRSDPLTKLETQGGKKTVRDKPNISEVLNKRSQFVCFKIDQQFPATIGSFKIDEY